MKLPSLLGLVGALLVGNQALWAASIPQSSTDLWDVSSGIQIRSQSGQRPGFQILGMFGGGATSAEAGSSVFLDGKPAGFVHYVEWSTTQPVIVERVNLFTAGDGAAFGHQREFGKFVLKAKLAEGSSYLDVLSFEPESHPLTQLDPTSFCVLSREIAPVTARFFRAEFHQWKAGSFQGPRVMELDGIGRMAPASPITKDPENATIYESEPFTLSVTSSDPESTYQWLKDGVEIEGATSRTFSVSNASYLRTGSYVAAVKVGETTHLSKPAQVTVRYFGSKEDLWDISKGSKILAHSGAQTEPEAALGSSARLTRETGSFVFNDQTPPSGKYFVEWETAEVIRLKSFSVYAKGDGVVFGNQREFDEFSLYAYDHTAGDYKLIHGPYVPAHPYQMQNAETGLLVSHEITPVTSSRFKAEFAATPKVFSGPRIMELDGFGDAGILRIASQPSSREVDQGGRAVFEVTAQGEGPFVFQWLHNGEPIPSATSRVLIIEQARPDQAGEYSVRVSNQYGALLSQKASLVVKGSLISKQPTSVRIYEAERFELRVETAASNPRFQWFKNNEVIEGAESSRFTVGNADYTRSGVYHVVVKAGEQTAQSDSAQVEVRFFGRKDDLWDVAQGAKVTVVSSAQTEPEAAFGSSRQLTRETGSMVFGDEVLASEVHYMEWTTPGLVRVKKVDLYAKGDGQVFGNQREFNQFKLYAFDPAAGELKQMAPTLTPSHPYVLQDSEAALLKSFEVEPVVASRFRVELTPHTKAFGGPRILELDAYGDADLLRIVSHPANLRVQSGASGSFEVSAVGEGELQYQWFFGDSPIPGATSKVLSLESINDRHAGNYSVRVSSSLGHLFSKPAALAVIPPVGTRDPSSTDLWDVSQGAVIVSHSGVFPGFDPQGMFGSIKPSPEPGSTVFKDGRPAESTHHIEWSASTPIRLDSFRLFASGDPHFRNQREFSKFVLKAKTNPFANDHYETIYSFEPSHPYTFLDAGTRLILEATITPIVAQHFRAEFTQWNAGRGFDGPRVIELDGFGARVEVPNPIVADWTMEEGSLGEPARILKDHSGRGHHFEWNGPLVPSDGLLPAGPTFVGSTSSADGKISVHIPSFSSLGNGFQVVPHDDFDLGGEFTVEASFAAQPPHGGGMEVILASFEETSGRMAWAILYDPSTREIYFMVHNQVNFPFSTQTWVPNDGRSHHVAGQVLQGEIRLYLDGKLENRFPSVGVVGPVEGRKLLTWLAPRGGTLNGFNGVVDRARITKAILAPEQFIPMGKPAGTIAIVTPPASATVKALGTARFEVMATGPSTLQYEWLRNGDPIPNSNSRVLEIPHVTKGHEGIYRVRVWAAGFDPILSNGATLTVLENVDALLPSFAMHPRGTLSAKGTRVTLSALPTGQGPISMQWFFNGRAIPGATQSSLHLAGLTAQMEGSYWLVASNAFGARESDVALVGIHPGPDVGAVQFGNRVAGTVDAPISRHDGRRLEGRAYLVQLYYLNPDGVMTPTGGATPFRLGVAAGYFDDPNPRFTPGILPQRSATFQVAAWAAASGVTYEEARAAGGEHGISAPFTLFGLGGNSVPQIPLAGLQPFSLNPPAPKIVGQPADVEVLAGGVAEFAVNVEAVEPTFQWFRGMDPIQNATAATLRIPEVSEAQAGLYHVKITSLGQTLTSREARLVVKILDNEPPTLVVESPSAGETNDPSVTLAGRASDNRGIATLQWGRGEIVGGQLELREGRFRLEGIPLVAGLNRLFVEATDHAGNRTRKVVEIRLVPGRFLALPKLQGVREGSIVAVPVRLSSKGDVGALNFVLAYNPDYLTAPELEWTANTFGALVQVNTTTPGRVRAVYALPGTTLPTGQTDVAIVRFRVRSVPENLNTPLGLEITGLYSNVGNPLTDGAEAIPGSIAITRRTHKGDNNANDRLDVGDASIMLRMVSLLEPVRAWDVAGNDLNNNQDLDSGDIIRVLRAAVGLDPQPSGSIALGGGLRAAAAGGAGLLLSAEPALAAPGQKVTVRLALQGHTGPLHGAAFTLDYPAKALRLENASAHRPGAVVSGNTLTLWNLAPAQSDYVNQSGVISAALSSATQWGGANGEVAVFEFTVLEGAATRPRWELGLSGAEISNGFNVLPVPAASVSWQSREATPATLSAAVNSSGQATLTLAAEVGARYIIQASGDLRHWENVHEATAESATLSFTDTAVGGVQARFYRALLVE